MKKAFEFQAALGPDRTIAVPPEAAAAVPLQESIRVILLVPDSSEDADWSRLSAEQFFKVYAEEDAIYDDLPPR